MRKLLSILGSVSLLAVSTINITAYKNIQTKSLFNEEYQNFNYSNKDVESKLQYSFNTEKSIEKIVHKSETYNSLKRLYIDSSGDKILPEVEGSIDDPYSKVSKNKDYFFQNTAMSIRISDYAKNKDEFLKKYNTVGISMDMGFNLWNSLKGWTYNEGKNIKLNKFSKNMQVKGIDGYHNVFGVKDPNHSINEEVRIDIKEEWDGDFFRIKYKIIA